MAFSPQFLDEIRARVALSDLIGRKVRLVKKGREHSGLCPFHNEKTPSFTVSEEKGFFHCFGCGAHGDAIGFVMRADGLSFPEAVERLAHEAGLEVPRQTPAERETAKRQASLHEIMDAACAFYEAQLRGPAGTAALAYLGNRGIDDETISRFRLGFAPESRGALKAALMTGSTPESLLIEAGLLGEPSDGGATYDRFRGRVMFPITDRRGRVIAFGARALGDAQPKYLNSPDTPLFNKGRVLYGLAQARRAALDHGRIIVTEGYTDVIALSRAGFAEAVAPLGTAITESQIQELWRLAPEPLLCFDGDDAGRRAAARAAERALPLLQPGQSLRFVTLPRGEDPDSLIASQGRRAMAALVDNAVPLADLIWQIETAARTYDSPERIAGLEKRLESRVLGIADRTVQHRYRSHYRDRVWNAFGKAGGRPGRKAGGRPARGRPDDKAHRAGRAAIGVLKARHEQVVLATALNHPPLVEEFCEILGKLNLKDPKLDKLRQEILLVYAERQGLESTSLHRHLRQRGFGDVLGVILDPATYVHAEFARPGTRIETARDGFRQALLRHSEPSRQAELDEAEQAYANDPTDENWARFEKLKTHNQQDRDSQNAVMADLDDHHADLGTVIPDS